MTTSPLPGDGTAEPEGLGRTARIIDTFLDGHLLLLPLIDSDGAVTDLRIVRADPAAETYLQSDADALVGRTVRELWGDGASNVLRWGTEVVRTGGSVALDDEPADSVVYGPDRYVDVRAAFVGPEISLTWRDVTERHRQRERLEESEARFRLVAENASGAVFSATADGQFEWVSPSVRDLLGWEPEDIVGTSPLDLVTPDDVEVMRAHMDALRSGRAQDYVVRLRTRSGGHRWIGVSARPVADERGHLRGRVGSWRDVTAEVEAMQALAASQEQYRLLAENASDLVALADNEGRLLWFSDSIRTYGWEPSDVVGHAASEFLHPDDRYLLREVAVTTGRGDAARVAWRIAEKADPDAWHWFRVHLRPVHGSDGHVVGRVSGWQNIDAEMQAQERLDAERDRLRATLESLMDPHVLVSPIAGPNGETADLRYEWANARACASLGLPPEAVIGASVRDVLSEQQADWTISLCSLALDSADGVVADDVPVMRSDGNTMLYLDVRVSRVGEVVSLTWRDVTAAHMAMSDLADAAADSERRLSVFEPGLAAMTVSPEDACRILLDFLESGTPQIALQPIVDVARGGTVVGLEALARFPSDVLDGPDGWFTAAHRCGLGVRLERAALRAAREAFAEIPSDAFLSVNVSPQALSEGALDELAGLDLSRIVVELTEHVPVADYALVMSILAPLRESGCRVAIDDAGAGFASLRHVINLNPDVIKLDAAIVRGLDTDPLRLAVARMMIVFSRGIGADLVCEGVETEAEAAMLTAQGAMWMQGYLYGRPTVVDTRRSGEAS